MIVKMKSTSDPYYSNSVFNRFVPLALLYTAVTNLAATVLHPFPGLRISREPLLPEDSFEPSGGDIAIVTGSNTGIGFETAYSLVERGYDVILACRSRERGERAAEILNEKAAARGASATAGRAIFLHPLDLSDFSSVRSFVDTFKAKYSKLNILVNNAGINTTGKSVDGFDLCFQTNFLGHFLLTRLLMDHLLKANNRYPGEGAGKEAGRVVNLSSVTHHFVRADEDRFQSKGSGLHDEEWWNGCAKHGESDNTYKESKLASALLTLELNERYSKEGLRAVTANPGSVNSDIWRNYSDFMLKYVVGPLFRVVYLDNEQGSRTSVAAAVGKLPLGAHYLQPYWQPWPIQHTTSKKSLKQKLSALSFHRSYRVQFPVFEMLGLYIGHAVTKARLPNDGKGGLFASSELWKSSEKLVGYGDTCQDGQK
eukprot:CAMPEP_0183315914 /NCGR_PEP_ID=MMETSP0160_2-20130417/53196_1 /TAXON_ID=2839 ORGANISM="Odontella Sinensis, Strain Grunow 1884" /NCGR_SAMPLE_ID=MMETSP0160_2 /ASSEMBLY_ACC=CAM_ASM_000250 /LENGTH=425 /DNA_ID=CAMNT_0025481587 /DNA_START=67 /DNA_END=1344 /DNA_ORIENTATION=+